MRIVYLAPVFRPAIGGGVVYLELMERHLGALMGVNEFCILTEKYPGQPTTETLVEGRARIVRKYPFRAGRSTRSITSYFAYAIQNLEFLELPRFLKRERVTTFIVHSSFHNNWNLLHRVIKNIAQKKSRPFLIADVRDPRLATARLKELNHYDIIVSCSENVTSHLSQERSISKKIVEIPIPHEQRQLSDADIGAALAKYGLTKKKYIFNGSGCIKEKGILELVELTSRLRQLGKDISLVVAGKKRYWNEVLEHAEQEQWLICTGEIPNVEVAGLSAGSWLDANLSRVDSFPRHSLDAIAVGSNVLLPRGVPELMRACPPFVADMSDIDALAQQAMEIASGERGRCAYDVGQHEASEVFQRYWNLLR
jgi:glycosyltransferase involved in cell wall biosynthesis